MKYISIKKLFKLVKSKNILLFIKYNIISGFTTLLDLVIIYILTEFFSFWYIYSVTIGYAVGVLVNYVLNKHFNFRNKSKKVVKQFGLFTVIALVGLVLNQIIIYALVEFLDLWYMFAKIIAVILVVFWNFSRHKEWTFKIYK